MIPEYVIYSPDTAHEAIQYIMDSQADEFSILKSIEIVGLEKSAIKLVVEESLKHSMEFMGLIGMK